MKKVNWIQALVTTGFVILGGFMASYAATEMEKHAALKKAAEKKAGK